MSSPVVVVVEGGTSTPAPAAKSANNYYKLEPAQMLELPPPDAGKAPAEGSSVRFVLEGVVEKSDKSGLTIRATALYDTQWDAEAAFADLAMEQTE